MKSKLLIIAFILVAINSVNSRGFSSEQVLSWDKVGYYLYLPATIIYRDITDFAFYLEKGKEYNLTGGAPFYGLNDVPNGNKVNKYAIGVAVMQLPFFLVAHGYASCSPAYIADGFNKPFVLAVIISNIFYAVLGLWLLRRYLLFYFPENTVFLTLLAIAFGTNLYYYTVYEQGMSHPYSFFLFAALLLLTHKWYAGFSTRHLVLMGVVLGLITIVRPVNILVALVPLLWNVCDKQTFSDQVQLLRKYFPQLLLAALSFALVVLIQLTYWKLVTGNWLYYSYGDEGFDFKNPQIVNGLFSYRKGWFLYTPIAFLGFLGLPFLWKQYKGMAPALVLFFIPMIYVIFSWKMWYYGGSFGSRPMIETLPLVAIPLSALFCYAFWVKNYFIKIPIISLTVLLIGLNLFQSYQYSQTIIHWDSMTKEYYWKVFGKLDIDREKLNQYLRN